MFLGVLGLVVLVSSVMLCLFIFISLWVETNNNSVSSYECGFDVSSVTRMSFSYRFFLVAIMFLIFDVEISLLLPVPYLQYSVKSCLVVGVFIVMLLMGLLYEIQIGSLDWLK